VSGGAAAVADLLRWYPGVARDLPWRQTTDPYAILVSEVMLQQTQVVRVAPRYLAWLERWPTAEALAAAPLADVLREWVGLGYNRRAVRLWEAAGVVASRGWPEDLRELPGVGPYTAAAVASFAFGRQVAAVDTNARRVAQRWGHGTAESVLPDGRAAEFNQAMMELGATVCGARRPRCDACPIGACRSRGRVAPAPAGRARGAARFEDTDRYARGRVVAALAAGEELPDLSPERLARVLEALVRDGLVVRDADGVRLP